MFFSTLALIPSIPVDDEFFSESIILTMPGGSNVMLLMWASVYGKISGILSVDSLVKTEENVMFRTLATSMSGIILPMSSQSEMMLS